MGLVTLRLNRFKTMDFSSPPPGGKMDGAQKGQLMEQVKAQIAVANAQELLQVRFRGVTTVRSVAI